MPRPTAGRGSFWGISMIRKVLCLLAMLFVVPALAQVPVDQLAKPPADAKVWTITSSGGAARHGQVSLWTAPDGTHWSRMDFNLRGFVTEIDEQNRFAADGTLASMVVSGKVPEGDAAETYEAKDGSYTFTSPVDHGGGKTVPNLLYASFGGTFDSFTFLLDAMRKSADHSIALLPSGRGTIEPLTTLDVSNGTQKKTLTAYAITGFGLSPFPVWIDGDKFFGLAGVLNFLPEGWEKAGEDMSKAQDAALAKRAPAQVAALATTPAGPVAFENVKLYDADARKFREGEGEITQEEIEDYVSEGVEAAVPYRGSAREMFVQMIGGLQSGMSYCDAHSVDELYEKAVFVRMTQVGLAESRPHDVEVM